MYAEVRYRELSHEERDLQKEFEALLEKII